MERTKDGFSIEITPVRSDKWDYRVTVKHPMHALEWSDLISGGYPIIESARNRLLKEARTLHEYQQALKS